MKKRGFTLVELLAVIVILAIIALISVPLVLNAIEDTKKGSAKITALMYVSALETKIVKGELLEQYKIEDGTHYVNDIELSYKGDGPTQGEVIVENGLVKSAKLCINGYSVYYNGNDSVITNNNYCGKDFTITLVNNDIEQSKVIGLVESITFENVDVTRMTNISCNNSAIPILEGNVLKVTNIFGNTKCVINDSIEKAITTLDETESNIVMIANDEISNKLTINSENVVTLDLNGNVINSSIDIPLVNYGVITLKSSLPGGKISSLSAVLLSSGLKGAGIVNVYNGAYVNTATSSDGRASFLIYESGILNVYGEKATFDENGNYIDGTYLAGNANSAINVSKGGGTLNMYSGTVVLTGDNAAIRSNISDDNVLMNIYNGEILSKGKGIGLEENNMESAIINIYDGLFSTTEQAVFNHSSGTVNIYGGKFISSNTGVIINSANGSINIEQTTTPIYITSTATEWFPAIRNSSAGMINIKANNSNLCNNDFTKTTSGLCVYVIGANNNYSDNSSNTAVLNAGEGFINIDGGTYFGGYSSIANGASGSINVSNGQIDSGFISIHNAGTGNINICNGKISSNNYDIVSGFNTTGKINYSSSVIFTNNTNIPVVSGQTDNIVSNYNGLCVN